MIRLISAELFRLRKRLMTKVLLIVCCAILHPNSNIEKNALITAYYEVAMLQQGAGNETKFAKWSLT